MERFYFVAKALYRTGVSKTGLMEYLAFESGTTALNYAVMRGDVEIVKILLENGAFRLNIAAAVYEQKINLFSVSDYFFETHQQKRFNDDKERVT